MRIVNKWTREETIIAFNLYCKIPFKSSSKTHPLVEKYARIIGRSGNFTAIKLLYNNTSKMPESIVYVLSSGTEFHKIKNQISTFGFEFYNEDVNTFPNAVAYCYYNSQLRMYAIFAEYFNNGDIKFISITNKN